MLPCTLVPSSIAARARRPAACVRLLPSPCSSARFLPHSFPALLAPARTCVPSPSLGPRPFLPSLLPFLSRLPCWHRCPSLAASLLPVVSPPQRRRHTARTDQGQSLGAHSKLVWQACVPGLNVAAAQAPHMLACRVHASCCFPPSGACHPCMLSTPLVQRCLMQPRPALKPAFHDLALTCPALVDVKSKRLSNHLMTDWTALACPLVPMFGGAVRSWRHNAWAWQLPRCARPACTSAKRRVGPRSRDLLHCRSAVACDTVAAGSVATPSCTPPLMHDGASDGGCSAASWGRAHVYRIQTRSTAAGIRSDRAVSTHARRCERLGV